MNQSSIMNDINAAAQELLREQPLIIPIAGDFTIVQMTRLTPTTIDYRVFASHPQRSTTGFSPPEPFSRQCDFVLLTTRLETSRHRSSLHRVHSITTTRHQYVCANSSTRSMSPHRLTPTRRLSRLYATRTSRTGATTSSYSEPTHFHPLPTQPTTTHTRMNHAPS